MTMRSIPQARPRFAFLTTLLALAALAGAGCGHPASRQECDEIFNKSAELELRLQNVTDPKVVAERTAAVRAARGDELIQQCIGKRITADALACVRKANSTDEMDQCLD